MINVLRIGMRLKKNFKVSINRGNVAGKSFITMIIKDICTFHDGKKYELKCCFKTIIISFYQ